MSNKIKTFLPHFPFKWFLCGPTTFRHLLAHFPAQLTQNAQAQSMHSAVNSSWPPKNLYKYFLGPLGILRRTCFDFHCKHKLSRNTRIYYILHSIECTPRQTHVWPAWATSTHTVRIRNVRIVYLLRHQRTQRGCTGSDAAFCWQLIVH